MTTSEIEEKKQDKILYEMLNDFRHLGNGYYTMGPLRINYWFDVKDFESKPWERR